MNAPLLARYIFVLLGNALGVGELWPANCIEMMNRQPPDRPGATAGNRISALIEHADRGIEPGQISNKVGDGTAPSGYTAAGLPTPFGAVLGLRRRVDNGRNINRLGAIPRRGLVGASGRTEFGGTVLIDSAATVFDPARPAPTSPVEGECPARALLSRRAGCSLRSPARPAPDPFRRERRFAVDEGVKRKSVGVLSASVLQA
jgi:hypothetical protein